MTRRAIVPALLLALAACSSGTPARDTTKTQAQRDSAVGRSGLPGSEGVMNALGAADSARARQARLDSAGRP